MHSFLNVVHSANTVTIAMSLDVLVLRTPNKVLLILRNPPPPQKKKLPQLADP